MAIERNTNGVYTTLGASNHSDKERVENDYYATPSYAVEQLVELEKFSENIWECAAGGGHISKVLEEHGYKVRSSDIIDRTGSIEVLDFLKSNEKWDGDIITNPPYKYAQGFVEKALDTVTDGHKVVMFLRLAFLETKGRRRLFDQHNLKCVYVATGRIGCLRNGITPEPSAVAFAWFVWEKGYSGEPVIRWFN